MKMSKPKQSHAKKRNKRWLSGHRPRGDGATRRAATAEKEGGTGQHRVHRPSHHHGVTVHWTRGGGATALKFQRAKKGDSGTALVTTLRVAVHRLNSTLTVGCQ
jgi:hypothetical protein